MGREGTALQGDLPYYKITKILLTGVRGWDSMFKKERERDTSCLDWGRTEELSHMDKHMALELAKSGIVGNTCPGKYFASFLLFWKLFLYHNIE